MATKEQLDQAAWETFARIYPHEAADMDWERFFVFVQQRKPVISEAEVRQALLETAGMPEQRYIFRWTRPGMPGRKGQTCKVLARGKMNSCLVEFEDGFRAVTSRNALRKVRGAKAEE